MESAWSLGFQKKKTQRENMSKIGENPDGDDGDVSAV